tara:strand:+ start:18685 stop:19377 length:693 start_codon:yes stop_codon:yes gene_type:complete
MDINNTFWINNPYILIDSQEITKLWPLEYMNQNEKLNAVSRLIILLTIIGTIITKNINILISGIVCIFIIIVFNLLQNKKFDEKNLTKITEGFTNPDLYNTLKHNFTNPNKDNPLMNVNLTEIQDNPERLDAAPSYNKMVEKNINDSAKEFIKQSSDNKDIKDKLFNSLGDNLGNDFEFEQSMRQFYTTANTRVCNNQAAFANFCYGNMASCRDGDVEKCIKNNPRHTNI